MKRIPTSPPFIAPLPPRDTRPVWSVMIPVYNCSRFIPDVLESVLRQEISTTLMQIEVVDDASTDGDVEEVVNRLGKGRIAYFRQSENVGSLRNFETCINRSKGSYIHLLHGDDLIKEGFYKKMTQLFHDYPEAGAAFSNYDFVNESGKLTHTNPSEGNKDGILYNWLNRVAGRQRIQYAAMVVKREVYENLGSFYGSHYGEDWEMWVRIAKYYSVAYTPEVLAQYRTHTDSISWNGSLSGQLYWDLLSVIDKIKSHLPEEDQKKILRESRLSIAENLLGIVYRNMDNRVDFPTIYPYIKKIFYMSKHPFVLAHLVNIFYKIVSAGLFRQKMPLNADFQLKNDR